MSTYARARSWLMAITLIWAGVVPARALAVEVQPAPVAELKARMKTLVVEALKVGDVWTAIQADAYASQKLGVRSAGILGAVEVFGDPLFAFPQPIIDHHPRADQVVVCSGQRVYRLALDGRPLAISQKLPLVPNSSALSADGSFLAVAECQRSPTWALRVHVRNLTTGDELFSAKHPLVTNDFIHGDLRVAPDGTAVSIGVLNGDNAAEPRLMVLRASGKHVVVPAFVRPQAISSDGTWGLAEPASNLMDGARHVALLHGGNVVTCRSAAIGPGVAAVIEQSHGDDVRLVARDGTRLALTPPRPLAPGARVLSTDEWLLVASGWSQEKPGDELDLLGDSTSTEGERFTTWFYRWSDVANGALLSQPVLTVPGIPGISSLRPTMVFLGSETAVRVVDLAQTKPEAKPLMTAAGSVHYIESRHGRVVLWLNEGHCQIIDESGADLWHGVATNGVHLHDPWFASLRQAEGKVEWVRLATDPAQRLRIELALPANDFALELDRYHRHLIGSRHAEWVAFDPFTGQPVKPVGIRAQRPQVVGVGSGWDLSPFAVQAARLVPRLAPPVAEDPASRWNPLDAWRVGGTLVVLDQHGQVHVSGRKRNTYQTLGSVDFPASIAQAAGGLTIANDTNVATAKLAVGPLLATEGPGIGQPVQPLAEGLWRVKNLFYVPPGGASLMWDAMRCGFTPTRLRSPPPPATGMLVVTDSLVFDLDVAAGKQFGVIDKAGLRDSQN